MDRGARRCTVHRGHTESEIAEAIHVGFLYDKEVAGNSLKLSCRKPRVPSKHLSLWLFLGSYSSTLHNDLVGGLLINQAISREEKVNMTFLPLRSLLRIWGNIPSPHPQIFVLCQTDFSHWSEEALFSSFHSLFSLRPLLASLPTCLSSWLSTLKISL